MAEELQILEVIIGEVGKPRNDGSRGSALYAVPFRLSRRPTSREAELLVHVWNHPPQFTTMHRPGIARVSGDRLILDGTTVEEVRDYHAKTLNLVIEKVNAEEVRLRAADDAEAKREAAKDEAHRQNIQDVAKDISF